MSKSIYQSIYLYLDYTTYAMCLILDRSCL